MMSAGDRSEDVLNKTLLLLAPAIIIVVAAASTVSLRIKP